MGLVDNILKGDEKSAARLITGIENGEREAYRELSLLFPHTGKAHIIGVTGPAGAGKSTLIGQLALMLSGKGRSVGVIATDPTSVNGKGAFLGDRVRMKGAEEQNVFIRSMAHRSHPGGIARAAAAAAYVMEGLGKDHIIVESIGAGQTDKDLFFLCDTVVTVFTPEYGDEVQLFKAGLMEIGDIIVVNKSDAPGADDAAREILLASRRATRSNGWDVPVLLSDAQHGIGIDVLLQAIDDHWQRFDRKGRTQRKADNVEAFMVALLKEELWQEISGRLTASRAFREIAREVRSGMMDPYSAVRKILDELEPKWTFR
ncbi:MAG: putative GTPase [Syntrophorhabdus sp. PtaB.Bin184]|jgi:LAO/AO transport system kinase|nr:MAG: putative GTPase [Syntrophorhabdus sp. PtaB.Bin184]